MTNEIELPELGENVETVEVSSVLVSEGDRIDRDQPVIEVETEKASLEVPATSSGRVKELRVKAGDQIRVGQVILVVDSEADGEGESASAGAAEKEPAEKEPRKRRESEKEEAATEKEEAAAAAEEEKEEEAEEERKAEEKKEPQRRRAAPSREREPERREARREAAAAGEPPRIGDTVPAAPSVRALARELGVDIVNVAGSGPAGRISADDVKAHARDRLRGGAAQAAPSTGPSLPDFTEWGEVRREPMSNVRRATARGMANSWANIPHVTQFDQADVTELEATRQRLNERERATDRKLSLTAIVVKVAAAALKRFPQFNASLDPRSNEIVYKDYVHIGVAVDTPRGLLVPVLRDADRKGLASVAADLDDLAQRARDKKVSPEDLRGASFTVSNLGGLGTTHFAPIVNWPEVAILGVGRSEMRPVWREGQFVPRRVMPLSISYDHRLIDGADAARFLRWFCEALEHPLMLLLEETDAE